MLNLQTVNSCSNCKYSIWKKNVDAPQIFCNLNDTAKDYLFNIAAYYLTDEEIDIQYKWETLHEVSQNTICENYKFNG